MTTTATYLSVDRWQAERYKIGAQKNSVTGEIQISTNPSNGTQNLNLYQYASMNGLGTGTIQATASYSTTEGIFKVTPPAGTVYRIARVLVAIGDTSGMTQGVYGDFAGALTNGIVLEIHNGTTTILDITAGQPIKTNGEWGAACFDVDLKSWGGSPPTNELVLARWTFSKAGQYLRIDGDASEEIRLRFNDDLRGLLNHTFFFQGYTEETGT